MNPPTTPLGPLLQPFFGESLGTQTQASPHTIASDRATVRLWRECRRDTHGMAPAATGLADLEVPVLLAFLNHLEPTRRNAPRSRHLRLAARRAFFRLVALRDPARGHHAARVLAIPVTRAALDVVSQGRACV